MIIFFILSALETFALGIYLVSVGSQESGAAFANLSLSRLVISVVIFLVAVIFFILAILALRGHVKRKDIFSSFLGNRKRLFLIFCLDILLMTSMIFLLTRPPTFGGDYRLVINRLGPVFAWLLLLAVQSAGFIAVWFCAYFIVNKEASVVATKKELLPLFAVFFLALVTKWVIVSSAAYGPGVGDEMTYYDMADSMHRGFFNIAQTYHYPPLYSLVFMPALVFGEYTFTLIKIINAVVSTAIVFPIYFLSRTFLDARKSLILVIISCFNPFHLVFPRRILSENLYFPIFLWTMYFVLKKPFKKTDELVWDVFTGIFLGLLYLTRYISLAVIPMFLIAWWVKPFDADDHLLKPSGKKILRFLLIISIAALVFSPWIICAIQEGVPVKLALGFVITSETNPEQLTNSNFLKWLILYLNYIIIMVSPYIPFLIKSISFIEFPKWRSEYGRWFFQILIVMAGFLAAATRHSWRAYYNAELPKILMGRYVLFLSVPLLILFCVSLDLYQSSKTNRKKKADIWLLIVSFMLVLCAYFVIVEPRIIDVESYFIRMETSADVYYYSIFGNMFFVFIGLLYCLYLVFFIREKNRDQLSKIISVILIVFFSLGWFEYSDILKARQTNSWLSSEVANLARASIPDTELSGEEISLFIPESFGNKEKIELYNGLRVRGFDNTQFFEFTEENVSAMPTNYGVVITKCLDDDLPDNSNATAVEFNDACFLLDVIDD